jgi:hypothetical protein
LQSGRRIKMATNNNGNLLDDAGNIAVDFVWGNLPLQPNDQRPDTATGRLDFALDNHVIAQTGWNGYPLYVPNTDGEYVSGTAFIVVPNVLGLTTALALDALKDAGYTAANITTASAATNAAIVVTAASRTAGSTEVSITATGAVAAYPVGTKITVTNSGDATVNGTWTVTGNSSTNVVKFTSTATTAVALTSITGSVVGVAGTIKTQSVAAGADSIALGTTVTVTPWATAS